MLPYLSITVNPTSPWVVFSWGQGLDALAHRSHAWLRSRPAHPSRPRPVLLNTWEAVYFDHDLDKLKALADAAAQVKDYANLNVLPILKNIEFKSGAFYMTGSH